MTVLIRVASILLYISLAWSSHFSTETCTTCSPFNDRCPLWYYSEDKDCVGECTFSGVSQAVSRNKACPLHANESTVLLQLGHCMTFNETERKAFLVACPYNTAKGHDGLICTQSLIINITSYQYLNNFMCSNLNRVGPHCQQCHSSFGQSVYTLDLSCHPCSKQYSGWYLYIFFEFVSTGTFLIVILVFQITPTRANMKAFVLFCQVNTIILSFGSGSLFKHTFGRASVIFIQILEVFYGFWNLDFFRSVIPPFCVDPNINNLAVLTLQYLSVVYPTIIIIVAWLLVDLHERGFRPILAIWRPFRRSLSHFSVTNDPKRTIISSLATLVTLSYTKVLYISITVTHAVNTLSLCGKKSKVLYLQPDISIFGTKHAPYIVISVIMVLLYIALPLLLLLLYSIQWFQVKLNSHCIHSHNIQMFVEAFHSSYYDGTNNKRNTSLFSTVYFFFRIFAVLSFVKSPLLLISFFLLTSLQGFTLSLLCIVRPYKNIAYTFLDAFFFSAYIMLSVCSAAISRSSNHDYVTTLYTIIYIAMGIPFLYACAQVLKSMAKLLELINIHSILKWRRRDYAEIGIYENEMDASLEREGDQMHQDHGRRVGQNNSFQSE